MNDLDDFLDTLKIHNKHINACFNDALAVRHLKELSQNKGNGLAAPEPLANTDAANPLIKCDNCDFRSATKDLPHICNPPQATIEDKLKDHIAKKVTAWFGEPVLAVEDEIQAIITTETTKAVRAKYLSCGYCGEPVEQPVVIQSKLYCNHSHRQLAYTKRKAEEGSEQ